MGALATALAVFVVAAHHPWTALPALFAVGGSGSVVAPALQGRLMDVAHDAQTLAAALNHSALNIGNRPAHGWAVSSSRRAWIHGPDRRRSSTRAGGHRVLTVSDLLQRRGARRG